MTMWKLQVTIRKVAWERQALMGLSDTSALEGGALHVAAMQEKHSTLDTLLELGAPPGARSGSGHTPMHSKHSQLAVALF